MAVLTILGIEVDSTRQIIRLPDDTLEAMQSSLKKWCGMKCGPPVHHWQLEPCMQSCEGEQVIPQASD